MAQVSGLELACAAELKQEPVSELELGPVSEFDYLKALPENL